MEGILACANTRVGRRFGPKYGVMNPLWKDPYHTGKTPKGYVGSYASYNMCSDTEWWPEYLSNAVARVCRETGIDYVRLDEYGHRGYVCTSDKHRHLFAEPGHNAWMQAVARACRVVHQKMDQVRPDLVLTTEFPGNDHLAATLEGAIVYDVRRNKPIRPVSINLFRFYFPECKVFEIDRPARRHAREMMLWNAVGAFSALYSDSVHRMLEENTDAFERRDNEPLVPTLVPRVYANRFGRGDKVIFTIFNGTGHTVSAPVLPVTPDADHHFVDLLNGRELVPIDFGGSRAIRLKLKREETVVVARLPRVLRVEGRLLRSEGSRPGDLVVAVGADGTDSGHLSPGRPLPVYESTPLIIELLRDGRLVDAIPWPTESR